jgi:hypothetical protein
MAVGALVVVGLLLVALGLFAASSFPIIALGVVCLIAAGLFEVIAQRR